MPQAGVFGQYVHADLYEMAAAYLYHIVRNHAFLDGNKLRLRHYRRAGGLSAPPGGGFGPRTVLPGPGGAGWCRSWVCVQARYLSGRYVRLARWIMLSRSFWVLARMRRRDPSGMRSRISWYSRGTKYAKRFPE